MRLHLVFRFFGWSALAAAQSHPSWWNYSSPSATALVGVHWQSVRASPFAEAVEAELWGDLGFPNLPCLHRAREFVISSPDLLALASGDFPASAFGANAGFKTMTYRGVAMLFATEQGVLSLARLNDQLVLIGDPKTLEIAIDRSLTDAKNYSPLLARASLFHQKDLWVVSSQLPDNLANRFVPIDIEAQKFEGSLSFRNGLEMDAVLTSASEQQANASAGKLRQGIPTYPAIAQSLQVTVDQDSVQLALIVTREQVLAALRGPEPAAKPVETVKVETPKQVEHVVVEAPEPPTVVVVLKPAAPKPPEKPQVIRIVGLDEGPREIVMPLPKPEKQPL